MEDKNKRKLSIELPRRAPPCLRALFSKDIEGLVYDKPIIQIMVSYLKGRIRDRADAEDIIFATLYQLDKIDAHNAKSYDATTREEIRDAWAEPVDFCMEAKKLESLTSYCKICPKVFEDKRQEAEMNAVRLTDWIKESTHWVRIYLGKTTYHTINIAGNVFEAESEEVFKNARKFESWFYDNFGDVLRFNKDLWDDLLKFFSEKAERTEQEKSSEEDVIAELILNKLRTSSVVENIEETLNRDDRVFIDDGKLYYPSQNLKRQLDRERAHISLEKLRTALSEYLVGNTTIKRVKHLRYRFWIFDPEKVGMEEKPKVSYEEQSAPSAPAGDANA